jgi:tetratricopeptide (TPR) repeat protein
MLGDSMHLLRLLIFVSLFSLAACQSTKKSSQSDSEASWAAQMRSMSSNLQRLLPFVYSASEFNDPGNDDDIADLIKDFGNSVDLIPQHIGEEVLGKDPLVKYSIERLKDNTNHALKAFKEGHSEYARNTLKASMSTCFNCHTSNTLGPETNFSTKNLASSFRMFPTEKADYYVATRQYPKAIEVLEKVLESPSSFYDSPHEQASALKKYLSLQVRVKKDPSRAVKTLDLFVRNKKLPYYLSTDAENWMESLRAWSREPKAGNPTTQARRLMQKANRKQKSKGYQAAMVEHLRATSLLHEALKKTKSEKQRSNIYFSLGTSYDVLTELGLWDLPDVYFEACIRSWPKSKTARKCYRSFERNLILGFSGSAGIFIPKEERARLAELKQLAGLK